MSELIAYKGFSIEDTHLIKASLFFGINYDPDKTLRLFKEIANLRTNAMAYAKDVASIAFQTVAIHDYYLTSSQRLGMISGPQLIQEGLKAGDVLLIAPGIMEAPQNGGIYAAKIREKQPNNKEMIVFPIVSFDTGEIPGGAAKLFRPRTPAGPMPWPYTLADIGNPAHRFVRFPLSKNH